MKVSRAWLQKYFDTPLPDTAALSDALTFHAFEIEEASGDLIDVKVLPNRAADCLCHRGIASELSAILDIPLKTDPLREPVHMKDIVSPSLTVAIEDPKKCSRYMGALVQGVKVGPSPAWLKEALEAVGQRSINNIVDATNYVMLNIGQPLHAFDAAKLSRKEGTYAIGVRNAKEGENITTLSGEEYALTPNIQLITDAHADAPIALAGVKGGKAAELTGETTDVIVESANFDGTTTRRAAQALKLFTDASMRFQNRPSPELAAYGMRDVLALIQEVAGGEVVEVVDEYPARPAPGREVSVSLAKINGILGATFSREEAENVFKRLALPYRVVDDVFTVTPPFERTDLVIPEDLVEEVGRIIGYDKLPATELPPIVGTPDQARYRGIEKVKDELIAHGFTEISTQSFAKKGEILLANPLDKTNPALRMNLERGIKLAGLVAKQYAALVQSPGSQQDLFEIGTAFTEDGEKTYLALSKPVPELDALLGIKAESRAEIIHYDLSGAKLEKLGENYEPAQYELRAYQPFSVYPFITRDIALWTPAGTEGASVEKVIREHAGDLLVRLDQFDRFEKEGRISYAFRLVFQSMERTLTDEEVNGIMGNVCAAVKADGCEVR